MNKPFSTASLAAGLLLLFNASTVSAVNGEFDAADAHPNVGALIVPAFGFFPFCSVVLIDDAVVLSAGHCTRFLQESGLAQTPMWVSFQADPGFLTTCFPGDDLAADCGWVPVVDLQTIDNVPTLVNRPPWAENADDVGALLLESTPQGLAPVLMVSAVGEIKELLRGIKNKNIHLTVVGYGAAPRFPPREGPPLLFPDRRLIGHPRFLRLRNKYLLTQQNVAAGNTGSCAGDSGGPLFLHVDGMQVLIALVNGGPNHCLSTGTYYRLDTAEAQAFIDGLF